MRPRALRAVTGREAASGVGEDFNLPRECGSIGLMPRSIAPGVIPNPLPAGLSAPQPLKINVDLMWQAGQSDSARGQRTVHTVFERPSGGGDARLALAQGFETEGGFFGKRSRDYSHFYDSNPARPGSIASVVMANASQILDGLEQVISQVKPTGQYILDNQWARKSGNFLLTLERQGTGEQRYFYNTETQEPRSEVLRAVQLLRGLFDEVKFEYTGKVAA